MCEVAPEPTLRELHIKENNEEEKECQGKCHWASAPGSADVSRLSFHQGTHVPRSEEATEQTSHLLSGAASAQWHSLCENIQIFRVHRSHHLLVGRKPAERFSGIWQIALNSGDFSYGDGASQDRPLIHGNSNSPSICCRNFPPKTGTTTRFDPSEAD